jgi:hypothetical protein
VVDSATVEVEVLVDVSPGIVELGATAVVVVSFGGTIAGGTAVVAGGATTGGCVGGTVGGTVGGNVVTGSGASVVVVSVGSLWALTIDGTPSATTRIAGPSQRTVIRRERGVGRRATIKKTGLGSAPARRTRPEDPTGRGASTNAPAILALVWSVSSPRSTLGVEAGQ